MKTVNFDVLQLITRTTSQIVTNFWRGKQNRPQKEKKKEKNIIPQFRGNTMDIKPRATVDTMFPDKKEAFI